MSLEIIQEKDLSFGLVLVLTPVIIHFFMIFLITEIDTGMTHLGIFLVLVLDLSDEEIIPHGEEEIHQVGEEDHVVDLFLFFGKCLDQLVCQIY